MKDTGTYKANDLLSYIIKKLKFYKYIGEWVNETTIACQLGNKSFEKSKIYSVGLKNHQCINTVFDKMHWQKRLI